MINYNWSSVATLVLIIWQKQSPRSDCMAAQDTVSWAFTIHLLHGRSWYHQKKVSQYYHNIKFLIQYYHDTLALLVFICPFEKPDVLCYGVWRPSIRPWTFSFPANSSYNLQPIKLNKPASVAQLDAPSDWRPGGRGFNPRRGRQHCFVEIDHEIFSTVILPLPLIQEGQLSVFWRKNVHNTG